MTDRQYINLENKYCAANYQPLDVVASHAQGVWVWDISGRKYLDFLSGYSALNCGHVHTRLIRAACRQLKCLTMTSRAFRNDQLGLFCRDLCKLSGFEMVLPVNTGAEAVETALKLARKWGYTKKGIGKDKAEIIVFDNNFHGRTISIISFSTEVQYRDGFSPFTPGFKLAKYNDLADLTRVISKNTVAVLAEPIQGEGGIIIPDVGYLSTVAQICRERNILFMLDEIQTGLGRTGKLFAFEHDKDAKPDVLILGKALGGGIYPVSAVLAARKIMSVFKQGDHGSTFGGNPLACAIARVAVDTILKERLVENSAKMGQYLLKKLATINSQLIKEVRGKGLLIGIELTTETGGARHFCKALMKEGILCKETHENVIRLSPPLNITKKQINFAVSSIKKVLES